MSRGYKRRKKNLNNPNWESPEDRHNRVCGDFYENVMKSVKEMQFKYENNAEFKFMVDNIRNSRPMTDEFKAATDDYFIKQFTS